MRFNTQRTTMKSKVLAFVSVITGILLFVVIILTGNRQLSGFQKNNAAVQASLVSSPLAIASVILITVAKLDLIRLNWLKHLYLSIVGALISLVSIILTADVFIVQQKTFKSSEITFWTLSTIFQFVFYTIVILLPLKQPVQTNMCNTLEKNASLLRSDSHYNESSPNTSSPVTSRSSLSSTKSTIDYFSNLPRYSTQIGPLEKISIARPQSAYSTHSTETTDTTNTTHTIEALEQLVSDDDISTIQSDYATDRSSSTLVPSSPLSPKSSSSSSSLKRTASSSSSSRFRPDTAHSAYSISAAIIDTTPRPPLPAFVPLPLRLSRSFSLPFSSPPPACAAPEPAARPPLARYSTVASLSSRASERSATSRLSAASGASGASRSSVASGTSRPQLRLATATTLVPAKAAEAHIHPLFRTDSPTPPPAHSPGTVVVGSPFAGTVLPRSLSQRGSLRASQSSRRASSRLRDGAGSSLSNREDGRDKYEMQERTGSITEEDVDTLPEFVLRCSLEKAGIV